MEGEGTLVAFPALLREGASERQTTSAEPRGNRRSPSKLLSPCQKPKRDFKINLLKGKVPFPPPPLLVLPHPSSRAGLTRSGGHHHLLPLPRRTLCFPSTRDLSAVD